MSANQKASKVGVYGELLVHKLLPGSKWIAGDLHAINHHDIDWEGIKIEVKTSTMLLGRTAFSFSNISKADADVWIFIGINGEQTFFWVKSKKEIKEGFYGGIKKSISESELVEAVRKAYL